MNKKRLILWLGVIAFLAVALTSLGTPWLAHAGRAAPTPVFTPTPFPPTRVGSNAHLVIGALVLVVIILAGVALNSWRKK